MASSWSVGNVEFHMACAQLLPLIPEARKVAAIHAERLLQPATRFERILLMPRYGGKTSIGAVSAFGQDQPLSTNGGWLDETPDLAHTYLAKTTLGMLKMYRTMRPQFPRYSPKITMRPETWDAIKKRFHWLEPHFIANLAFPQQAFYSALAEVGATSEQLEHFNLTWLKTFHDAAGRLYPGLAFDALERTCEKARTTPGVPSCKWQGAAEACAKFFEGQRDIRYWVGHMVPDDRATIAGAKFLIPVDRFQLRLRQARRKDPLSQLPFGLNGPQFARWGTIAGIWTRLGRSQYYTFALPYSIGASFLKARLTEDAFRNMSKV